MFSLRARSIGTLGLAALLACGFAVAQSTQPPSIERQMTPEQFKAAGLHTIDTESSKAAEFATQKVKTENRGFFDFGSEEPIVDRLVGEFRGFGKGKTYTLANGQVWQQIDDTHMSARLADPEVRIKPAMMGNSWYMAVGKYNTQAQVKRVK